MKEMGFCFLRGACCTLLFPVVIEIALAKDVAATPETLQQYFCPNSNTTFVREPDRLSLVSGPYIPFPRTIEDASRHDAEPVRRLVMTRDCSNSEFSCIRIEPGAGIAGFFLFSPRQLFVGRAYNFNGMQVIAASASFSTPQNPVGQLTIWQRIDGREVPITLTLKSKVGAIYVDGLELWNSPTAGRRPETCSLVSSTGFFSEVVVAPSLGPSKPIM